MNKDLVNTEVLILASQCFDRARLNLLQGAEYLHKISKESLWQDSYSSFGAYVEDACQISESYASKLVNSWEHYVVRGGLSQRKIEGIDPEKLYLAMKLDGTPEEQALKAKTLSRQELKAQRSDDAHPHCQHDDTFTVIVCRTCNAKL